MAYSCWLPSFALRKYRVEPSGENAGSLTLQPSGVIPRGGASPRVSRFRAYRAVVALSPASTLRWAKTTLRPSGASTGEETRSRLTRSRTSKPRASARVGRAASRQAGSSACRSIIRATPLWECPDGRRWRGPRAKDLRHMRRGRGCDGPGASRTPPWPSVRSRGRMCREEAQHPAVELTPVGDVVETVALLRVVQRLHRHPGPSQGGLHAPGVLDRGDVILAAGGQEHRRLDLAGARSGRGGLQHGGVGPDPLAQPGRRRAAAVDVVAHHLRQVVDPHVADRAPVQV